MQSRMIVVNQTWLKLAERTQESSKTIDWVASIVLNKLQKRGKAKITQVTF